jgi:hypothetical protein
MKIQKTPCKVDLDEYWDYNFLFIIYNASLELSSSFIQILDACTCRLKKRAFQRNMNSKKDINNALQNSFVA